MFLRKFRGWLAVVASAALFPIGLCAAAPELSDSPAVEAAQPLPAKPSALIARERGEADAIEIDQLAAQKRQARWDETAAKVIDVLERRPGTVTPAQLATWEELRAQLASQRDEALAVSLRGTLPERIAAAQLAALGPPPANDSTEDAQTARRRAELEDRLVEARGPSMAADDSYARAVVLIDEIDRIINAANRALVFKRNPSPLLPSSWATLVRDLETGSFQSPEGVSATRTTETAASAPSGAILLLIAALVLGLALVLALQRKILGALDRRISRQTNAAAAITLTVVRDAMVLLLPLAILLVLLIVGKYFEQSAPVLSLGVVTVAIAGLILVFGVWLGQSLLSPSIASQRFMHLSDNRARRCYQMVIALSAVLALEEVYEYFEQHFVLSPNAAGIAPFLLMGAAAYFLFYLSHLIRARKSDAIADTTGVGTSLKDPSGDRRHIDFGETSGRAMEAIAVAIVALSAIGYDALARDLLSATLGTMTIVALAILTFRRTMAFAGAFGGRFARSHKQVSQLAPVALGLVLILIAVPLILMIWGVRAAQLGDLVSAIRNGVSFGDLRISIGDIVTFALVFTVGYVITRWIQRVIEATVMPRLSLDEGSENALLTAIGYAGLLLSALIAITSAGLDLSSLAIVFGALSVGIGFGLQNVVANFISGIILLVERPIKKGDWIKVGDTEGIVEKVAVRATHIKAFDRDDVIIPNSDLISDIVRNRTLADTLGRVEIDIGIAYESDVAKAIALAKGIARGHAEVVEDPSPSVAITQFGDSALNLQIFAYIRDVSKMASVRGELNLELLGVFKAAGISIPYPQRRVHLERVESAASI